MDHQTILTKLGGPHAVRDELAARGLELKPVTVRAWALGPRRIPAKYWTHIIEIAFDKGVKLDFADLAESVAIPTPKGVAA